MVQAYKVLTLRESEVGRPQVRGSPVGVSETLPQNQKGGNKLRTEFGAKFNPQCCEEIISIVCTQRKKQKLADFWKLYNFSFLRIVMLLGGQPL